MSNSLATLIQALPKVELHLHIEGSLEPELMMKLADRNGLTLDFDSVDEIRDAYEFDNLQDFLDIYYEGAGVLLTEQDFYDLTWAYLEKMDKENVRHVEIFFDPQTHTERSVAFSTVILGIHRALSDAKEKLGITSKLIMCFLRHLSESDAFDTLDEALSFKHMIDAVGLDSSEDGHPPEKFRRVFEKAIKQGWLTVAHAGEEGPPKYIWQALNLLDVSRIDHGVRCVEDEELVQHLIELKMPLTVCPLSNIKLCVFDRLEDHNLKTLLNRGLCVTVNSDDPAYFGGYLSQNFLETAEALDLTDADIVRLVRNSVTASFMTEAEKADFMQDVDRVAQEMGVSI